MPSVHSTIPAVFADMRANVANVRTQVEAQRKSVADQIAAGTAEVLPDEMKNGVALATGAFAMAIVRLTQHTTNELNNFTKDPCCAEHLNAAANSALSVIAALSALYAETMGRSSVMVAKPGLDSDLDGLINSLEKWFLDLFGGEDGDQSDHSLDHGLAQAQIDPTAPLTPDVSGMVKQ